MRGYTEPKSEDAAAVRLVVNGQRLERQILGQQLAHCFQTQETLLSSS